MAELTGFDAKIIDILCSAEPEIADMLCVGQGVSTIEFLKRHGYWDLGYHQPSDFLNDKLRFHHKLNTPVPARFPSSLISIACEYAEMKIIPNIILLPNLQSLCCGCNEITSLPKLPERLETLNCYINQISELPESFPISLKSIDLSSNKLTGQYDFRYLVNLEYINLRRNPIPKDKLPLFPKHLIVSDCGLYARLGNSLGNKEEGGGSMTIEQIERLDIKGISV
jgi:hypothetical protein